MNLHNPWQSDPAIVAKAIKIPFRFKNCAFMKDSRGFAIYSGLPSTRVFSALRTEASSLMKEARKQETWEMESHQNNRVDFKSDRERQVRRCKQSVGGGPIQIRMYQDPRLSRFLSDECGLRLVPSGRRGSYTYYARPGDFLGLHRDTSYCDLVMITVLEDNSSPHEPSGSLVLYPGRTNENLSSIRATPKVGAEMFKILPGQTILLMGGVIPHRVIPTGPDQKRVISALCFRALR